MQGESITIEKSSLMAKQPAVMMFHLNRVKYTGSFYEKKRDYFDFPESLPLEKFDFAEGQSGECGTALGA